MPQDLQYELTVTYGGECEHALETAEDNFSAMIVQNSAKEIHHTYADGKNILTALLRRKVVMAELVIEATPENMNKVLAFVENYLEDCPPKVQNQIGIVVDEIFSNIARYAYNPKTGTALVRILADKDIVIEFEDKGVPYNPLEQEEPDITLSAEEREVGGLGLFMVKNLMDSVLYRREGDTNILTIKKKL